MAGRPPDEFAPNEAGLILLGDTQRASRWVPYARQKIREGIEAFGEVFSHTLRPERGVEVLIRVDFEIHKITINASGTGLWYEFFSSDPILEEELATADFLGQGPSGTYVAGDAFLTRLGSSNQHVDFISDIPDNEWQHFITTQSAWSNQKRIGSITHLSNHRQILASNHSNLKHMRFLNCRLDEGMGGFLHVRNKITDIGFNVPTSIWDESGSSEEVARSVPNAEENEVDAFVTESNIDPSTGAAYMTRPTTPYHGPCGVQKVMVGGVEKEFFLYTDIYARFLRVYEVTDDWPSDGSFPASNPTPTLVLDIPLVPDGGDPADIVHFDPNTSFNYSGVQWVFNSTGTRMTAVMSRRVPEVLPDRFTTAGQPLSTNHDVDIFTGNVVTQVRHESLRPLAPLWGNFFSNSFDLSWQLQFYYPVIIEVAIDINDNGAGFITGELSVVQTFDSQVLDRYFVAADYDINTDELVVAEVECYAHNGNLYHFTHPTDPDGDHEAEDIESAIHCSLKITRWRESVDPETQGTSGYLEQPKGSVTLWESDVKHLYENGLNSTQTSGYDAGTFKAILETFGSPFSNLLGHGSGSLGLPSSVEDDSLLNILPQCWKFVVGGLDLRLGAYWGQHERISWTTEHSGVLNADVWKTITYQSFLEYGVDGKPPVFEYMPPGDPELGETDWGQPEPPRQIPEGFEKISPLNHLVQSVSTYCLKGLWYGEWSVHPRGRSYALATPAIYCRNLQINKTGFLEDGSTYYPLHIDVIFDGGSKKELLTNGSTIKWLRKTWISPKMKGTTLYLGIPDTTVGPTQPPMTWCL